MEEEVGSIKNRWENVCGKIVERISRCEEDYGLMKKYKK
jgi:hypothetical protein